MKVVCLFAYLLGRDLVGSRSTLSQPAASRETTYLAVPEGTLRKTVSPSLLHQNNLG